MKKKTEALEDVGLHSKRTILKSDLTVYTDKELLESYNDHLKEIESRWKRKPRKNEL